MTTKEFIDAVERIIEHQCKFQLDVVFALVKKEFGDKIDIDRLKELYTELSEKMKKVKNGEVEPEIDKSRCTAITAGNYQCTRPPLMSGLCKTHWTKAEKTKSASPTEKSETAVCETSSTPSSEK